MIEQLIGLGLAVIAGVIVDCYCQQRLERKYFECRVDYAIDRAREIIWNLDLEQQERMRGLVLELIELRSRVEGKTRSETCTDQRSGQCAREWGQSLMDSHAVVFRQVFERPVAPEGREIPASPKLSSCVACNHEWPASDGVGCPRCVHGPPPSLAEAIMDVVDAAYDHEQTDDSSSALPDLVARQGFGDGCERGGTLRRTDRGKAGMVEEVGTAP